MNFTSFRGFWHYAFLLISLLPLLFINVQDSQGWGGDFAMYIHQAKNIASGLPHWKTGYLFNPDYPHLAPPAYPPGFPLMLSPVYALFGNSIKAFSFYISILTLLLGLATFGFYRQQFSPLEAFMTVLVFLYSPWLITFKAAVISDIPFSLVLMGGVLIHKFKPFHNPWNAVVLGIICGYLITIRTVGAVLLIAVLIDQLRHLFPLLKTLKMRGVLKSLLPQPFITFSIAISVYILITVILFPSPFGFLDHFIPLFGKGDFWYRLVANPAIYLYQVQNYFWFLPGNTIVVLITRAFMLAFLLVGFIKTVIKRVGFIEWLCIIYGVILWIWPFSSQGFRYLLPVFPFVLYYVIVGLRCIKLPTRLNPVVVTLAIAFFILFQYSGDIYFYAKNPVTLAMGPQEPESIEAFNYIREHTPKSARVAFIKPRVLNLYAEREAMSNLPNQDQESMKARFEEMGIDYFLVQSIITDEGLKTFVNKNPNLELMWQNKQFQLYRAR